MAYGTSILSKVPADWTLTNGTMTSTSIVLQEGGSALIALTIVDVEKLPATAQVTLVADTYGTQLESKVEVIGVLPDNTYIAHTLPIIDTGNGVYSTIITFPEQTYISFIFKISSTTGIRLTEWSLGIPVTTDFTDVIDGVKQEIPKLLWDYNTYPFQVGQDEETVGMISARLFKTVDLQGHLQINCTASEDSTVVVRISDNEIQELYSPIEYVVKRGRNSIGIPHAYIARKIGIHNFLVTVQVKTGTLTVETRGVLYTIDGGYLATRIMDVGYEVYDITIKQLPTDQDPSEIYAVCIEEGKALIRKRPLNDEVAVAWEPAYIIEGAVQARIEFHGLWILRPMATGFTLETEEQPYVIWRDESDVLWSQQGPDVSTKFQLATGVSTMSVCMGYNYVEDIQYDHGIICVYIKEGKAYYKNLCRQDLIGGMIWSSERELTQLGSGVTDIMVNRLNDYRTAINAIGNESMWLISDRGYVGQAARPEHSYLTARSTAIQPIIYTGFTEHDLDSVEGISMTTADVPLVVNVISSGITLPAIPNFTFTDASWLDGAAVALTGSAPMLALGDIKNNIIASTVLRPYEISEAYLSNAQTLIVVVTESLGPLDTLNLLIRGSAVLQFSTDTYHRWTVPSSTVSVNSPILSKQEALALTNTRTDVSSLVYTALQDVYYVGAPESLSMLVKPNSITPIVYTQVGSVPI